MNPVIFGCSRSGSSIFGELFKNICPAYRFEPTLDELKEKPLIPNEGIKLPTGPQPRLDGLAINLDELDKVAKYGVLPIWLVRHPYDTVCSLRPQMSESVYGRDHPPPMPLDDLMFECSPLVHAAAFWSWVNGIGFKYLMKHYGGVKIVKYEEIVKDPSKVADTIQIYTGLNNRKGAERWINSVSNEKGGYEAERQDVHSTQDHSIRMGRYKENLSKDERRLVRAICFDTASKFHYRLELE